MRKRRFHNIEAFDCLPKGRYGLVLHWLYSAWIGNYGNAQRGNEDREALLSTFLTQYADHVVGGGLMLLKLVDAISDLRERLLSHLQSSPEGEAAHSAAGCGEADEEVF